MGGGLLGIAVVMAVAGWQPVGGGNALVVASMGASAVLIFAVPHGALSQPWPVLGGHLVSALVGVSAARWIVRLAGGEDDAELVYRGMAGADRRVRGISTRAAFARWARYEVERDENTWRRVSWRDGSG